MEKMKITFSDKNITLDTFDKRYRVEVEATANYWRQPCRMYYPDGSGEPEDEDYEIENLQSKWFEIDGSGNEKEITPTEEMIDDLYDYLYYSVELDEWDFPENPDDEPDCEEC